MTAFYGDFKGARYRAVLVKQKNGNLYVWSWHDAQGALLFIDLIAQTRRVFTNVVGGHRSLHSSGEAHTRVEMESGPNYVKETLRKIEGELDFGITVPLDGLPTEAPNHAPWREVDREIVLRSGDFAGAAGVDLIFSTRARALATRPDRRDHCWRLDGDPPVIVRAERIAYPGRP
ncbi:MAG: hypothetical protein ACRD3J_01095 [Thermoanaerobaculia bacterium]